MKENGFLKNLIQHVRFVKFNLKCQLIMMDLGQLYKMEFGLKLTTLYQLARGVVTH